MADLIADLHTKLSAERLKSVSFRKKAAYWESESVALKETVQELKLAAQNRGWTYGRRNYFFSLVGPKT
jgi:hypothetical protein